MRYAVINPDGLVVNVIVLEDGIWTPPVSHIIFQDDMTNIGDTYDFENSVIIPKPTPVEEQEVLEEEPIV